MARPLYSEWDHAHPVASSVIGIVVGVGWVAVGLALWWPLAIPGVLWGAMNVLRLVAVLVDFTRLR